MDLGSGRCGECDENHDAIHFLLQQMDGIPPTGAAMERKSSPRSALGEQDQGRRLIRGSKNLHQAR